MGCKGGGNASGFTLIELMATIGVSVVIITGVGVLVADGSGWFSDNYSRVHSQPAVESLLVRNTFQQIVRRASRQGYRVIPGGDAIEVNYYSNGSSVPDRYAQFYTVGSDLRLETGMRDPRTILTNQKLCSNVSICKFKAADSAAQMILVLDDGENRRGSVSSAFMHNE